MLEVLKNDNPVSKVLRMIYGSDGRGLQKDMVCGMAEVFSVTYGACFN